MQSSLDVLIAALRQAKYPMTLKRLADECGIILTSNMRKDINNRGYSPSEILAWYNNSEYLTDIQYLNVSNKDIASKWGINAETVRNHREQFYQVDKFRALPHEIQLEVLTSNPQDIQGTALKYGLPTQTVQYVVYKNPHKEFIQEYNSSFFPTRKKYFVDKYKYPSAEVTRLIALYKLNPNQLDYTNNPEYMADLHNTDMINEEVALKWGYQRSATVRIQRKKLGISVFKEPTEAPAAIDMYLADTSLSDIEVAVMFKISESTVNYLRKHHNYKPQRTPEEIQSILMANAGGLRSGKYPVSYWVKEFNIHADNFRKFPGARFYEPVSVEDKLRSLPEEVTLSGKYTYKEIAQMAGIAVSSTHTVPWLKVKRVSGRRLTGRN